MIEYNKVNVKLSNTQLKKLKNAAKNKTGKTLRISWKIFNGNNLPHELLLTTRQKTKVINAFNNNMSTDLKFSKALSKNSNVNENDNENENEYENEYENENENENERFKKIK